MDILQQHKAWIDTTLDKLDAKLSLTALRSRDKIPYTAYDGVHDDKNAPGKDIAFWTNGFWGGLMWLMYRHTEKECYRLTAKRSEQLLESAWGSEYLHHDVGFMWHILSGAAWRLTGDEDAKARNLQAAEFLYNRYNEKGGYIVAWNGEDRQGWSIIDTMMNLSLLYWAGEETGDMRFIEVAKKHADMALMDHVRADGSVVHIVSHYTDRPGVIETKGGQGYGVGSCWSRGASWAVYGFAISYHHTGEVRYLDAAKRAAHYFISNVAVDGWLPRVDFRAPKEPECYDSTAGAIAACGLLEIAEAVGEQEKELYISAAIRILRAMEERWCNWQEQTDFILDNGTVRYGAAPQPIIYGDFFFTEALLRLAGSGFFPW